MALLPASAFSQTARVNIVHNSPYAAASVVDVYVNGSRALDDFRFRDATGFINLPAQVPLKVDITAGTATSNANPVFSKTLTLNADQSYILVAAGNPGAAGPTAFDLFATATPSMKMQKPEEVQFTVFHGAPDAPTVDVAARGAGVLVNDLAFGQFAPGYLAVAPGRYDLDIQTADNSTTAASFLADLTGLKGQSFAVLASGFLSGQPSFGLLAVFDDGRTMLLPANTARVQVIHNAPYSAAAVVDVYINGTKALDNFRFRDATPYLDLPAGSNNAPGGTAPDVKIDITGPDAPGNANPVFTTTLRLKTAQKYVVVAAGDPTAATGPNRFGLFVTEGREAASAPGQVDVKVFHGSPDAPVVDVAARKVGVLVNDLAYGNFSSGYLSVPPAKYDLDVQTADNSATAASFQANLSTVPNLALVVLASGFLNPAAGQPSFGLLAVAPGGETAMLPASTARVQIIHNSPYAAASVVDVYVNGAKAIDDFRFRTATPYIDLPAGSSVGPGGTSPDLKIDITAANASGNANPVFSKTLQLMTGEKYVIVAAGDPSRTTGAGRFDLFAAAGREASASAASVDLLVFHGSPDAPAVDVVVPGPPRLPLVNDIAFGEFRAYQSVPVGNYVLNIEPADNSSVAAVYDARLADLGLGGAAIVVLASGFLSPTAGQPGFGLYAALPSGGNLAPLVTRSGVATEETDALPDRFVVHGAYPNPFNPSTTVRFDLPENAEVGVEVFDLMGRRVLSVPSRAVAAGSGRTLALDASALSSGTYLYRVVARLSAGAMMQSGRMTLLK